MTHSSGDDQRKIEGKGKTIRRAFVFGLPGFVVGAAGALSSGKVLANKPGYPPPVPTFMDYLQSFMATFPQMLTGVMNTVQSSLNIGGESGGQKSQAAKAISADSQINTLIDIENKRIVDASETAPSSCLNGSLGSSLTGLSKQSSAITSVVQARNIKAAMGNRSAAKKSFFERSKRYLSAGNDIERNLQVSSQFFLTKEGYTKKHIARYFMDNLKGELEFLSTSSAGDISGTSANIINSRKLTFVSRVSLIDQALETIYMDRVRHASTANKIKAKAETGTEKAIADNLISDGGSSIVDLINFEVERTASSTDGGWSDQVDGYISAVPLHKELLELVAFKNYLQLRMNKQAEIISQLKGLQALLKIEERDL